MVSWLHQIRQRGPQDSFARYRAPGRDNLTSAVRPSHIFRGWTYCDSVFYPRSTVLAEVVKASFNDSNSIFLVDSFESEPFSWPPKLATRLQPTESVETLCPFPTTPTDALDGHPDRWFEWIYRPKRQPRHRLVSVPNSFWNSSSR